MPSNFRFVSASDDMASIDDSGLQGGKIRIVSSNESTATKRFGYKMPIACEIILCPHSVIF